MRLEIGVAYPLIQKHQPRCAESGKALAQRLGCMGNEEGRNAPVAHIEPEFLFHISSVGKLYRAVLVVGVGPVAAAYCGATSSKPASIIPTRTYGVTASPAHRRSWAIR